MRLPPLLARLSPFLLPAGAAVLLVAALVALPLAPAALGRAGLLALLAALAGLYRPAGLGLGAGAATLPIALAVTGWGSAVVIAGVAVAAVVLLEGAGDRRRPRRGRAARVPPQVALHVLAAGSAALAAHLARAAGAGWTVIAGAVAWLLPLLLLPWLQERLAGSPDLPEGRDTWRQSPGLLLDAAGWALGWLLLHVQAASGWPTAAALLAAACGLAAEAGRQRHLRRRADDARSALERLGRAGHRLAGASSGTVEVAQRVHQECRQVLPFSWFHLEIGPVGSAAAWHAGPDGELREGAPRPPGNPPPMPGIHRRASWQIFERRLLGGGAELARLSLWCDPRRLTAEALALFDQLVPQLAALVHRAVLDRQAHQDPLTGVALRRVLDHRLQSSFARSLDSGDPLSVALLDLDFFKRINDRFGHATGDRALVAVADVLRSNLRDGDLCARYGGEEFTLLFEDLDGASALVIVERLRAEVEAIALLFDDEPVPLSLSAGVVCFPEVSCRAPEELLELADAALYEAKRLGRNCALLHLGRGRYRDGKGRAVETDENPAAPQAPTLFA
jgi:diguanylate cyclase (GGDEF)-like protein